MIKPTEYYDIPLTWEMEMVTFTLTYLFNFIQNFPIAFNNNMK